MSKYCSTEDTRSQSMVGQKKKAGLARVAFVRKILLQREVKSTPEGGCAIVVALQGCLDWAQGRIPR